MDEPKVLQGAEPFYAEGGRIGILVSHGFTGCPQSMRYLAEQLAQPGYSVALPRLKGHGTTVADMAASTATNWIADLHTALFWLQQRCDTCFMTGLSMGGTLTLFMAGQYPGLFKGILPINPLIFTNNPDLASLAYMVNGPNEIPGIGSDIKAPGVSELAYATTPVSSIKELYALAKVTDELLPRIAIPTLIFVSREDHVVLPANTAYILNKISSTDKRQRWLEESYHVATLDNDKDIIVQESLAFLLANA